MVIVGLIINTPVPRLSGNTPVKLQKLTFKQLDSVFRVPIKVVRALIFVFRRRKRVVPLMTLIVMLMIHFIGL